MAVLHFTGKMFADEGIDGVATTDKANLSDSQIAIARDNATDEQASKFKADYGIDLKTASPSEIRNVLGDFNKSIPTSASELILKDGVAKFDTGETLVTIKPNGEAYDLTELSKSGEITTKRVTESELSAILQGYQKTTQEAVQGIAIEDVESLAKEWIAGYSELSLNKRTRINEAIRSGKQFNISDNVLKGTCYIIANRNNLSIEFSDKITQNGVWHKQGKNTYAVINAKMEADTIRHTVLHETFHDLSNRKGFTELVNDAYAKSLENDKAEVEERTAQYKEQFPNMSEQAIKEEIAADYFGKELSGEETFSETFSYKYKSLWTRAKLYITNLASKLRGKDNYTHSEVSEVGKLFDSLIKGENVITLGNDVKYRIGNFSEQVDQVINGTFDKENSHILVRNSTPKVFIETAGMKNLPIIISFDKLSIAMFNNGKLSNHYHNLGAATIKQIPTALESPLYIFESTNPKRIEAVIQLKDYRGRDIFTVIEFDGSGRVNGKFITANILVTAFGAQTKYIQDRVNNSKILYDAIKIGSTPQVNPRGQFPSVVNGSEPNTIISNSSENSNSFEKKSLGNDKNTENEARFLLKEERQRNITEIPLEQKNIISREDRPHIRFSLSDMQYESQEYIQRKKELREKAIKNPRPAKVLRVFEGKQEKSWRDYFVLLPADFFDDANTGYLGENGFYVLSAISSMEWQNYDHYLIADVDLNYFTEWVADEKEANENGTICQYWSEIMNYDYTEIKASLDDMDAQNVNVYKLPDQIKLTTNLNPTGNEDIRYSLNKYTPKATASAKALIDSEIITNEINAHFWQWHSEAVAELIDKEMAKADERTVAERINSISDKIMQEGKFSKTLDEYTKEILAKNKAEYKAIAEYYKQVDLTGLHKSLIKEFGEIDGGNFILFWGNDSGTGMDINQIAMCLIQS